MRPGLPCSGYAFCSVLRVPFGLRWCPAGAPSPWSVSLDPTWGSSPCTSPPHPVGGSLVSHSQVSDARWCFILASGQQATPRQEELTGPPALQPLLQRFNISYPKSLKAEIFPFSEASFLFLMFQNFRLRKLKLHMIFINNNS